MTMRRGRQYRAAATTSTLHAASQRRPPPLPARPTSSAPLGGPVTPPIEDEEVWTNHAPGYILPNFECGAKANTCTVEFEDETVTTDDYGVVDKDDTDGEWRWECHSDNGTVRQCALPKGDG